MSKVRVRFAPSPTGGLHIGGVRTALFNYLFAKKHGGDFILRIEDTDQTRYVEGAEEYINQTLRWLKIDPDEGPAIGGPFIPYRQSERQSIYKKYAEELLEKGLAYYAFDTPEELDEMRAKLKSRGMVNLNYNSASRMGMKNSLTLSESDVQSRLEGGEPYVIRVKIPEKDEIRLQDMVRGWVHVHSNSLDDKVILKSDGLPTYHLANIVDDHLMKITHVIRGEEWLPSAPLHVLLYRFLGWEDTMPKFAHLPLILKADGNGKLSKRAADKAGFPIFPMNWSDAESESIGFKESGYLPGALINFLALLGWNPGTDQEIFNIEELTESFSIERIGKAGTKFDIEKAKWFNQQYLNAMPNKELGAMLIAKLGERKISCDNQTAEQIADLFKTRASFVDDIVEESLIFFQPPSTYDEKVARKKWSPESETVIKEYSKNLKKIEELTAELAQQAYQETTSALETSPGKHMQALRLALTGKGSGADLMRVIEILGAENVTERINYSSSTLNEL